MNSSLQVRVYWGDILYDTLICDPGQKTRIGRGSNCALVLDLGRKASVSELQLLNVRKNQTADLFFDPSMDGHVRSGGKLVSLEKARKNNLATPSTEGLFQIPLGAEDSANIVVGYVSLDISWTKTKTILPRPVILDRKAAIFSGAVVSTILTLLTLLNIPVEKQEEPKPERLVEIFVPEKPKPVEASDEPVADNPGSTPSPVAAQPKPAAPPPPTAAEKLRSADLSSVVNNLSSLSGSSLPQVKAEAPAVPKTTGSAALEASEWKTSSVGKSVEIGQEVAKGVGTFQGATGVSSENAGISSGTVGALKGPSGTPSGNGLDKQVIDQIVRRRQDRIRLCYERQLNFVPNLAGKITVQFTIGKTGAVLQGNIIEDTMQNKQVRDCIQTEVKTWTFPRPKGDADVVVDYPFVFESGGH